MNDGGNTGVVTLILVSALLASCVATRNLKTQNVGRANQYLHYGVQAFSDGQYPVARSRIKAALVIFEKVGYADGQIRAHIDLADLALQSSNIPSAISHTKKAEALIARSGAVAYQRRILLIRSTIYLDQGDYAQARAVLGDLLGKVGAHVADHTPDSIYMSALVNRALLSEAQNDGELPNWVQDLERALTTAPEEHTSLRARLLRFQAHLYRQHGEFGKAARAYQEALSIYNSGAFDVEKGATLSEWAQMDVARDRWLPARDKLRRSILLLDRAGDRKAVLRNMGLLAEVESKCGRLDEAKAISVLTRKLRATPSLYGNQVQDFIGALRSNQNQGSR